MGHGRVLLVCLLVGVGEIKANLERKCADEQVFGGRWVRRTHYTRSNYLH